MTRTISFIIGIAVVALVAVPTALAERQLVGQPEPDAVAYFYANERATLAQSDSPQRQSDSSATAAFYANERATLADRPASSYYTPQVLQRMGDSWAARGGVLTNVPASSYLLPQQIETMSQGWAARGGLLPASAKVTTNQPPPTGSGRDVEWPQIGIGFGIGIVLAIVLGLTLKATRPRTLAH